MNWAYANSVESPLPTDIPATGSGEQTLLAPPSQLSVDADGYVMCSESMQCIGALFPLRIYVYYYYILFYFIVNI